MSDIRLLRVNPGSTFWSSSMALSQRLIRSVASLPTTVASKRVSRAAQRINHHAEDAIIQGFNSANVAQIT